MHFQNVIDLMKQSYAHGSQLAALNTAKIYVCLISFSKRDYRLNSALTFDSNSFSSSSESRDLSSSF